MKVLLLNTLAPHIWGGAEELAVNLYRRLNEIRGVKAELMRLPFQWNPEERLLEELLIAKSWRITGVDRVIALKFPVYLVEHKSKVLWVLHQFRQAYDLWDAGYSNIQDTERGRFIRDRIRQADNECFPACQAVYCNAPTTQDRMRRYNNFPCTVLPPPLNDPELFTIGEYQGYIFAGGRVSTAKRQHLLIEAMQHVPAPGQLIIAGPPESAEYAAKLEADVERLGLKGRVILDLKLHSRERIGAYASKALACAYLPFDEDSMGYVTLEAFQAAKAVLTAIDTGGVLEVVTDGVTGVVCKPEPESLGAGMTSLFADRKATIAMGQAAHDYLVSRYFNWPYVIERLLA